MSIHWPAHPSRRLLGAAIATVVLGAALPQSMLAGEPSVVTGALSSVNVPHPGAATVARLDVGQGEWLAWATLSIRDKNPQWDNVPLRCALQASGAPNLGSHVGRYAPIVEGPSNGTDTDDLDLMSSGAFKNAGGAFLLKCGSSRAGLIAERIRIVAMKVEHVALVTTNSAAAVGVPAQTSAALLRRTGSMVAHADWTTVATLALPDGNWWLHASLNESINPAWIGGIGGWPTCRLVANGRSSSSAGFVMDQSRGMLAMDLAGSLGIGRGATSIVKVQCKASLPDSIAVSDLRVSAVRAGKLTLHRESDLATFTIGSGEPRLIHSMGGTEPSISPGPNPSLVLFDVPAGYWLIKGTLSLDFGKDDHGKAPDPTYVSCTLSGGSRSDSVVSKRPGDQPIESFTIVETVLHDTVASLDCIMPQSNHGVTKVIDPHVSLIKLSSWSTDPL